MEACRPPFEITHQILCLVCSVSEKIDLCSLHSLKKFRGIMTQHKAGESGGFR